MSGSGQRANGQKAGGMRIDDHKFFAGGKDKETVAPRGVHIKGVAESDGDGSLMNYEDTEPKITSSQKMGVGKMKSHGTKPGYRNQ